MKKLLVVTGLVLSSIASYGQFTNYYMGDKYEVYKNKLTKIDVNNSNKTPSHKFWNVLPTNSVESKNIIYPNKEYSFCTDIINFKDRVFKIDSIFDFESTGFHNKIFRLVDVQNNNIVYYNYNTEYEFEHFLLTEPLGLKDSDFVNDIEREKDDFTGEVKITTPYGNQVGTLYKYINKKNTMYYLSLEIGSSGIHRGRGVHILFTDGTKWSRPNEVVDVDYRSGFVNNVFIRITQSDLQIFKTKTIKKYRLYIHDQDVDRGEADKFKIYSSLIVKSK
jgi:hypothetical protein